MGPWDGHHNGLATGQACSFASPRILKTPFLQFDHLLSLNLSVRFPRYQLMSAAFLAQFVAMALQLCAWFVHGAIAELGGAAVISRCPDRLVRL